MSKVASSTVFFTLKNYFNLESKDAIVCPTDNKTDDYNPDGILKIYHAHCSSEFSLNLIDRCRNGRVDVITLVRDPIARNISNFFESPLWGLNNPNTNKDISDQGVDMLINQFFDEYDHDLPITWFDNEFNKCLKVDMYEYDCTSPYTVINKNNKFNLLVLRAENLTTSLEPALREFWNDNKANIDIVTDNVTKTKHNGSLYQRFLDKISVPQDYIDRMYKTRFMTNFYTTDEIQGFIDRWTK